MFGVRHVMWQFAAAGWRNFSAGEIFRDSRGEQMRPSSTSAADSHARRPPLLGLFACLAKLYAHSRPSVGCPRRYRARRVNLSTREPTAAFPRLITIPAHAGLFTWKNCCALNAESVVLVNLRLAEPVKSPGRRDSIHGVPGISLPSSPQSSSV